MRECPAAVPFSELATVNPSRDAAPSNPGEPVSFIAMSDVSEDGAWVNQQKRPFSSVKQGFTSFTEGDVLVAKITPCLENGKGCHARGLVGGVGFGSTEFHVLRAAPGVSSRFLYHWSRSPLFRERAKAYMTGSAGQQRVSTEFFDRFLVPGLPLAEQRLIAEILDTADDAIRLTEQTIAKLEEVRKGLLHDLLTRGIDENGEIRDPERHPERFMHSAVGRIPRAWDLRTVREVMRTIEVGIVVRPTQYYAAHGIPVLRSANVTEGRVDTASIVHMTEQDHAKLRKSQVTPGDLVTVRTGYPGTTAVIPPSLPVANCVDIIISRPGPEVDSEFVAMWVNSEMGKGQVLRTQGGLAQQHFNVGAMKRLLVVVPDLAEQGRIVAAAQAVEERLEMAQRECSALRAIRTGLADDLLTGRVRVPIPEEAAA